MHFKRFLKVVQWRYSGGTVRYSEVQCPLLGYDLASSYRRSPRHQLVQLIGARHTCEKVETRMGGGVAHMARMRHSSVHCRRGWRSESRV